MWLEGYDKCYQGNLKNERCEKGGYKDEDEDEMGV
jgi:hypothetical protein